MYRSCEISGVAEVSSDLDVAETAEAGTLRDLLEHPRDGLDVRMVGRDAEADEPPGCRQPFDHVDLDRRIGRQQLPGGVEARRSRADDGDPKRPVSAHDSRCYKE